MKSQLHAGYILNAVKGSLKLKLLQVETKPLLESLSVFEIDVEAQNKNNILKAESLFCVAENIISRGLPTIPSVYIEETILKKLNIATKSVHSRTGAIQFDQKKPLSDNQKNLLHKSFFIVDPRIKSYQHTDHQFDSNQEIDFFQKDLPNYFDPSICQIVETQRSVESITEDKSFKDQRVDFSIQTPNKDGLVIEIDGSQHAESKQSYVDNKRDESILSTKGWSQTVRINANKVGKVDDNKILQIQNFLDNPFIKQVQENYHTPIWSYDWGMSAMQLTLTPLLIARIQKTLIHLITNGVLDINSKLWTIAIIERDLPCAELAIEDFKSLIKNLFELEGLDRKLPEIKYEIYVTSEFKKTELNKSVKTGSYPKPWSSSDVDLLIDVSILQRDNLSLIDESFLNKIHAENIVTIRSSHSIKEPRLIKSSLPISYNLDDSKSPKALQYLLQNIFRKDQFREGQVNIIRKSLKQENVIALLPTGAGKSLTYQISALLQPGIVLIVDPIKSLMKDQDDNLKSLGIDTTVFINSFLKAPEKRLKTDRMVKGFYQFIFIAPERLQMEEFRDSLSKMKSLGFTYCVVDEAHCVSEWGHDFRTAYLSLGENVKRYCKTRLDELPILALTGTASFDVLSDVQRELGINNESAIIRPDSYGRKELQLNAFDVGSPSIPKGEVDSWKIKNAIAKQKQRELFKYLKELPYKKWSGNAVYSSISSFFDTSINHPNSGLIFCPHKGGEFGVNTIQSKIIKEFKELAETTGVYSGGSDDQDSDDLLIQTQDKFKNNKINLLVATKAFGMGIDKPNIRFTVHLNMPQSVESFYQEAGRAGRDRELAYCLVLYSQKKFSNVDGDPEYNTIDKSNMLAFHHNSFKGRAHDDKMLFQLLNKITFPERSTIKEAAEILGNIDVDFKLKIAGTKLYVNGDTFPLSYGAIDIRNKTVVPENRANSTIIENSESRKILLNILQVLQRHCPSNLSLEDWLNKKTAAESMPGFEKTLDTMKFGDPSTSINVPFTNNAIKNIVKFLSDYTSRNDCNEGVVIRAKTFCFTPEKFVENLEKYGHFKIGDYPGLRELMEKGFSLIRDQDSTFKAIYRLSIIGVVDEHSVNYLTKTITAVVSKKKDNEYIDSLSKYIGRYVSREESYGLQEQISNYDGESVIQKCCSYLTHFVEDKIEAKRLEAINVMESYIQSSLEGGNLSEYVNNYFDSKYTSEIKDFLGSDLYESDPNVAWEYLHKTKGMSDAVSHLHGACDRLLIEDSTNPVLLVMRAFSRLLTLYDNKNDAINDLKKGLEIFKINKKWSTDEYWDNFWKFYEIVKKYNKDVLIYLDNEIIDLHKNEIKKINQKLTGVANA